MNLLKRVKNFYRYAVSPWRKRAFDAGKVNRLTGTWPSSRVDIDSDIRSALLTVRARARSLMQNNDFAKKYRNLMRTNILNHSANGFNLQMDCGEFNASWEFVPDVIANRKIEAAWIDWSKRENCSVNGRNSFRAIQDILVSYLCRDGEAMLRFVYGKRFKYGIALEIVPVELLDESMNEVLPSGNEVRMGVEIDKWRRPVAYWLREVNKQEGMFSSYASYTRERERVPAEDIIHGFDQEYENQTRGISWLVQSMSRLQMLSDYEEASLVNARVSASKVGFFTTKAGEASEGYKGEGTDAQGNIQMDVEPGSFEQLPDGMDLAPFTPEYPSDQHADFIKATLRGVSAGMNVSYASLSADLADANYSSNRVGMLDEREGCKMLQQFYIETFSQPIFSKWLESALLSGAVQLPFKFEKFNRPYFVGRRWGWIDPQNEVESYAKAVGLGIKSRTQIIAEEGGDRNELFKELADENAEAEKLGLVFSEPKPPPPQPQPVNVNGNGRHK